MTEQYQPQYRVHGTTTWSNWGSPITGTSAIIGQNPPGPALTPSTQYDFQVIASNSFGSAASATISATTSAGVSINSIALSPQSFTAGAAQGTVVGAVTVTMSSGSFSGSLSVTGTDASFFQISGSNLVLSGTTTTARTYSIDIVAAQSGLASLTQNFPSITANAASQESAEGFIVTTVGPTMFASTSAGSAQNTGPWNQFALVSTGTNDFHISLNGSTAGAQAGTGLVTELIYHNHTAYQANSLGGWWRWDTTGVAWVEFGASAVSLSASSYSANAPANTLIGTISVTMLDGTAFTGLLKVNDTTHFKIVGSQLQAATTLSATSYPITITAVPAVSGANNIGEQATLTLNITQTGSLIQPLLGAYLGPFLGGGAQWATSINAHWSAFNSQMGRTAGVVGCVMANAFENGGAPNTWGSGESGTFAANSIPTTSFPQCTFVFTDGSTTNVDFTDYANGTFDSQILSNLAGWKSAGFTKMYIRANWEFDQGGPSSNMIFPSQASVATFVSAYKHFANVCHTWGNNNGVTVRIVWSPTTNSGFTADINGVQTSVPVSSFFPIPDGNGTGTGNRYVDVIGCDLYAFGFSVTDPTTSSGNTNLSTNTGWFLKSFVQMCQAYNCNLGFSESGVFAPYGAGALTTWCNTVGTYLNTLATLSPAVPIEYFTIYDVHTTVNGSLFVPSMTDTTESVHTDYLTNFKALLGAQNSRSILTIPPI